MSASPAPTALLVEDEPSIRQLLADVLGDEGYPVLEAWNGRDAIRAVNGQTLPVDSRCVELLDWMLPGMDGLRALQQFAAPGGRVPVVAMSASRPHLAAAQARGADAMLSQPFDLDQLLSIVAEYCPPAR